MAPVFERIVNLLSSPGGNLFYSLILGLLSICALVASAYARGEQVSSEGKRLQVGLILLFLAQMILFGMAWLSWLGVIDAHAYLPPLDRCLALFSLVLIMWLWAFPRANKIMDVLFGLLIVMVVFLGGAGVALWLGESTNNTFNASMIGGYAYYAGVGLILIGITLLIARQPSYWGFGFFMFVTFLAGYVAQFLLSQPAGDYSLYVHTGEMVGFFFLLILPKRLINLGQGKDIEKQEVHPIKYSSVFDASLFQDIAELVTDSSPQQIYQRITIITARILDSSYCLLLIPPKSGEQLIIPIGYDKVQNKILEGFTADGYDMPSVMDVVKTGKALLLSNADLNSEIKPLLEELGINQAKQFMVIPFRPKGSDALMALGLISTSEERMWTNQDVKQLEEITKMMISSIGKYSKDLSQTSDQSQMLDKLQKAQAYADQVRLEYAQLKAKYDSIATQATMAASQAESMALLAENQKLLEDNIRRLEARNRELENLISRGRPSMEEVEQLRQELRAALTDLARIPSTLSKSDQKMLETQLSVVKSLDKLQPTELVTSIAQDFRQPLSSIVGYTDLLLGESVGLLGAMQRKFLERIKASTERLGMLMNELVQVIAIDGGAIDQTFLGVELKPAIEEAIGNISAQIKEKNIDLEVTLPEKLPAIRANQDALQQIVSNLLENACLVSPQEGVIKISGSLEQGEGELPFMLISVVDQGGGISNEDLPRVFLRRYKMENPLIQGVGDTGVGLSIVKSLVELLKGRVWVDNEPGIGATFSVLLPLAEEKLSSSSSNNSSG